MYDPLNVYRDRYKEFIESVQVKRPLNEKLEYCEDHHIVPRCTFEDKNDPRIDDEDNHINLTYREHFIAHKILKEENPDNYFLFLAYWRMCNGKTKIATPEEYEEARKEWSKQLSSRRKGKPLSDKWRANMSKAHKGYNPSEETRRKQSIRMTGTKLSLDIRKKLVESHKGHRDSEETRKKKSESMKGKRNSLGVKHPNRVYKFTCVICGQESIGRSSKCKYCDSCKEKR